MSEKPKERFFFSDIWPKISFRFAYALIVVIAPSFSLQLGGDFFDLALNPKNSKILGVSVQHCLKTPRKHLLLMFFFPKTNAPKFADKPLFPELSDYSAVFGTVRTMHQTYIGF